MSNKAFEEWCDDTFDLSRNPPLGKGELKEAFEAGKRQGMEMATEIINNEAHDNVLCRDTVLWLLAAIREEVKP